MNPQDIAASYTATNPMQNADFLTASKIAKFYNELNESTLAVIDAPEKGLGIVAIQQATSGASNPQITPFSQLRGLGIKETDLLYLFIARTGMKKNPDTGELGIEYCNVATGRNLVKGNSSLIEGAVQMICADYNSVTGKTCSRDQAIGIINSAGAIKKAQADFVQSSLG